MIVADLTTNDLILWGMILAFVAICFTVFMWTLTK